MFSFSGRASSQATLSCLAGLGFTKDCLFSKRHGLTVTVPGAAAAWVDTVENFGSGKVYAQRFFI